MKLIAYLPMLSVCLFWDQTPNPSQAREDRAAKAVATVGRQVVESYLSLRYYKVKAGKASLVARDLREFVSSWLTNETVSVKLFAGSDSAKFEEALQGYVTVCSDYAAILVESERAVNDDSMTITDRLAAVVKPLTERNRLPKAFDAIQALYRTHSAEPFDRTLSPVTYYFIHGPLLVSPVEKAKRFNFEGLCLIPDLGLTSEATIGNSVLTEPDLLEYDTFTNPLVEESKRIESSDLTDIEKLKRHKAIQDEFDRKPFEYFCSLKPGDLILGVRKKGSETWSRTANWSEVSRRARALDTGARPFPIEVLIGRKESASRTFQMLAW